MGKREEYAEKYCKNLEAKTSMKADMDSMLGIIKATGPSIYLSDSETVSSGDKAEVDRVKNGFMKKHLNLEGDDADKAFDQAVETYGKSNTSKFRAVLYYILAEQAGKLSNFA